MKRQAYDDEAGDADQHEDGAEEQAKDDCVTLGKQREQNN
jgi:hypothetical protein